MTSLMLPSAQAILYIRSLPQMDKKDFLAEFPGANPQGKSGRIFKRIHAHNKRTSMIWNSLKLFYFSKALGKVSTTTKQKNGQ